MFHMKVRVEFVGIFRELTGCSEMVLDIPAGSTVYDLISSLAEKYGRRLEERTLAREGGRLHEELSVLLNGRIIPTDEAPSVALRDKDAVVLMQEVII